MKKTWFACAVIGLALTACSISHKPLPFHKATISGGKLLLLIALPDGSEGLYTCWDIRRVNVVVEERRANSVVTITPWQPKGTVSEYIYTVYVRTATQKSAWDKALAEGKKYFANGEPLENKDVIPEVNSPK